MTLALAAAVPYLLIVVGMGYVRQAAAPGWVRLNADRDRGEVAADVYAAVAAKL